MASIHVRLLYALSLVLILDAVPAAAQSVGSASSVRLLAGDLLRLEVRDEASLSGEYRVDESGRVLLPLVGLVPVAGRDFEDVRREVEAGYARELHDREVRLTPLMRIAVLGEVRQPALYSVDPTMTLAHVLALAGGLGPEADPGRIELVREGRVASVVAQGDVASFAQPLRPGDQIMVPRRSWARAYSAQLIGAVGSLAVALVTALLLR